MAIAWQQRRRWTRRRVASSFVLLLTLLLSAGGLTYVPPATAASTIGDVGPLMNRARAGHVAVMLADGRVLVAFDGGAYQTNAEIYDPARNRWTMTGPMVEQLGQARLSASATLLPTGEVLVAGGDIEKLTCGDRGCHVATATTELYSPITNTWRPGPPMHTWRQNHTATLLPDGKVLVVGGYGPYLTSADPNVPPGYTTAKAELYDPTTNTWTMTTPMHHARMNHTATLLPNGDVLIAGGQSDVAEVYRPSTGTWTETGEMYTWDESYAAGPSHTATLLPNGKVFVLGGRRVYQETDTTQTLMSITTMAQEYDPSTQRWSLVTMPPTRMGTLGPNESPGWNVFFTTTLLPSGEIMVIGRQDAATEIHDPVLDQWSVGPSTVFARYLHTTTPLADGRLLIAGGTDNGEAGYPTTELFTP